MIIKIKLLKNTEAPTFLPFSQSILAAIETYGKYKTRNLRDYIQWVE